MERISFSQWTLQEVEKAIPLERRDNLPALANWLAAEGDFTSHELAELEQLRHDVLERSSYWSEEELKFFLIGPLIRMANIRKPLTFFAGRAISANVGEYELTGIVDGLVATGHYEPETPYFCLHEYKPERSGRRDDPAAQVLSAMLAARQINQTHEPVYGAYVLGRMWFFLVLIGNQYAMSGDFSASKEDEIRQIVLILRRLNTLVTMSEAAAPSVT